MVATQKPASLRGIALPALFVLAGIGVAAGIATAPSATLNEVLARSGIAALIPAAAPPVGLTGRALLALFVGGLIAALGMAGQLKAWLPALLARDGGAASDGAAGDDAAEKPPVVRRADAHPDAPPRRPIRAGSDLGQPLPIAKEPIAKDAPRANTDVLPFPLEPRAAEEQPLPADLDQPMSAFDPAAVPPAPAPPPEPVAPLYRAPPRDERIAVIVPDDVPPLSVTPVEVEAAHHGDAAVVPTALTGLPLEVATVPSPAVEIEDEAAMVPFSAPLDALTPADAATTLPQSQPADEVPATVGDDSIAGLLARLEQGAQRRRAVPPAAPVVEDAPDAVEEPAPAPPTAQVLSLDETLRNLRRMAAR